ncbi:hypothetical protein GSI_09541 [Ganoderma sinense ZZ0214-1]|uniref:BTB domain-containing protein n=1 Tax=Ganoderma sinense ZZ0214-1 TaxID=1077348 RepID=A0A2G8S3N9_9APHY|nr:hypothetical protein GSI_09541 [Ganoderma sinense ZZ0214-1]
MQSQPSSSSADISSEPQKDPELWFEDGNVVIVAGTHAAFRVHAGVLSRHSEIFQNTFGVPQPPLPSPSDVIDGRPVVHVSDSAYDFKQLLHMLYDGARFMPPDRSAAFGVLAAVARLGHKYHIEWVLEESKRRLRSIFRPASYEEWLKQERRGSHLVKTIPSPSWIETLNLIQLLGETDMLPIAIYQCCQVPSLLFGKGMKRADGTAEMLDLPTIELCTKARVKLIQRQSTLNAETFCTGPSGSCKRRAECRRAIVESLYLGQVCRWPSICLAGDPTNGDQCIPHLIEGSEEGGDICDVCAAALMKRHENGKRKIWEELPTIIGVPVDNWDQRMDDA